MVSISPKVLLVSKHTLWRLDANLLEPLRLLHGPDDGLDKLLDLLVETTNVRVLLCRLLIDLHGLDSAVVLGRKRVENEIGVLIDTNKIARLQGGGVDQTDQREEDGLSCRCLDDCGLAHAGGIQIDVGALLQ